MKTFPMARSTSKWKWPAFVLMTGLIALILLLMVGVWNHQPVAAAWGSGFTAAFLLVIYLLADRSRHVRFEVGQGGLRVRGDWFGRAFALSGLRLEEAQVLDLTVAREYRPKWRTCGTSLPGYDAGDFSLYNGRSAVAFLSDRRRVLCVPISATTLLLLSTPDPDALLRAMKEEASTVKS